MPEGREAVGAIAESVDGAEHGAMMSRVMADGSPHPQRHSPPNTTRNESIVNCGTRFRFA